MEDLEDDRETCEMCEVAEIRYVHIMTHPEQAASLRVGCVCAEHMEQDYTGPRLRERRLVRRGKWLRRRWWLTYSGTGYYLNTDQFHLSIWPTNGNGWTGRITDNTTERTVRAKRVYPSEAAAKLAAFDAMLVMKGQRP